MHPHQHPPRLDRSKQCPECQKLGKTSLVYVVRTSESQLPAEIFYDDAGRLHRHDPNPKTTEYRCANAHVWTETVIPSCWCQAESKLDRAA